MINVSILDKQYCIKNEWTDVTIRDMVKAQNYINNMPKWLENYIYNSGDAISEHKMMSFYIDWIELFSDIPKEYLQGEIKVEDANDVSLTFLFDLVAKFLGEPTEDEIGQSEVITLKNKEYKLIESVKTAGGVTKMLAGATFKHFAESQALSTLFQKKQYRKWEYIAKITAILFREDSNEIYEEEVIEARCKSFRDLPVSEAYKGYFFLLNSTQKLQESLVMSLNQGQKGEKSTHYLKKYLQIFIGKIKRMKSQLKEFIQSKVFRR